MSASVPLHYTFPQLTALTRIISAQLAARTFSALSKLQITASIPSDLIFYDSTATNSDLHADVEARRFRQDLFFRLNVFPVEAVPLRECKEDIPLLAAHFVSLCCHRLNRPEPRLTQHNVKQLQGYH